MLICTIAGVRGEVSSNGAPEGDGIERLLARVPQGSAWQDLAPELRTEFEKRAQVLLDRDRQSWGIPGLTQKEEILASIPTAAMTENIDRVLSVTFASETPHGFRMARDVINVELRRILIRLYLTITQSRGFMIYNHPEFRAWDGGPVKGLPLVDHIQNKAAAEWARETEARLRRIPDTELMPLEKGFRDKSYFLTRREKHFEKPNVARSGSMEYAGLYNRPPEERPFSSDADLLDDYNASMFATYREVNVGTLDAFIFDYESEFNDNLLNSQGMSDILIRNILKLANLFRTRVQSLTEKNNRCTIFSLEDRHANWDAFTAGQLTNADGSESMEAYERLYDRTRAQRLAAMQDLGRQTVDRLFPDGSPELTGEQRMRVVDRLRREKRPAAMMDTLLSTLDDVTGAGAASKKVREAIEKQPKVGGSYAPGEPVRDADKSALIDMWDKIRAFIKREYGGYRVDIVALIPPSPVIVTTGQNQFTLGGQVNLSLGSELDLISFSSTIMHEIKHAIDQSSRAAVEGAAWEGAATSVERQVWPLFIEDALAARSELLPIARLKTEIDNVRFTATTDATLKIFLRRSCGNDEPDTISFAEDIVRSYGYTDPNTLRLRSRRAHRGTQYLEYEYGLETYADLLTYLQDGVGSALRVDAFLLQACGMPSPKKSQLAVDSLKACIRERKS